MAAEPVVAHGDILRKIAKTPCDQVRPEFFHSVRQGAEPSFILEGWANCEGEHL